MAKRLHFKIFSMVLALIVLGSTVSFTIQKHFCGDNLIEVAVFSKAKDCGMDMAALNDASVEKKHCCKDEIEIVKGQDKLKLTSFEDLHLQQQLFLTQFVYSYTQLFGGFPKQYIPHNDYSPPNLVADIQVLDQVFII